MAGGVKVLERLEKTVMVKSRLAMNTLRVPGCILMASNCGMPVVMSMERQWETTQANVVALLLGIDRVHAVPIGGALLGAQVLLDLLPD